MKIKDISITTFKNHVESAISFEMKDFKNGCYLVQSVFPFADEKNISCQMMAGIPSPIVMTSADAVPAIPSDEKNEFPYCLETKVFDGDDCLIEKRRDSFLFVLPLPEPKKKIWFRKFFGN